MNSLTEQEIEGKGNGRRKNAYTRIKAVFLVVSALVVTASGGLTVSYIRTKPLTTEEVAARICPCIVGVIQYQKDMVTESGEGSGIVLSSDGYIVTNNHVIDGAYKLEVVSNTGKRYTAKTIGSDARTDLAVIKIAAKGLSTAQFGDSSKCSVGEKVVAVGNPSGLKLAGSVTQGILSAINRDIDVGNGPMSLLQTDAAINPGNSGGALVDMTGKVIGINSAKIAQQGFEGIGFSIPISYARPVINSLIQNGYVKGRVKLGLGCQMIEASTASANHLPGGALIQFVEPSSDAKKSGIKEGDIITSIDNVRVDSTSALICERDRHKPGDAVTLTIYRRATFGTLIFSVKLMEDRGGDAVGGGMSGGW